MATRAEFQEEACGWYGVKWTDEGRTRRGVDCAGLLLVAGWATGLIDRSFNPLGYTRQPQANFDFVRHFEQIARKKPYTERRPGDFLIHREDVNPCHCSILLDRPGRGEAIIHASLRRRRVTYDPLAGEWGAKALSYCFELNFED